jgi:hypothetical protein
MFKFSPNKLLIICSFALSGFTPHLLAMEKVADSFDTDPRHLLVRRVQTDYLDVIKQRKALLGTAYDSVALVDVARERLEHAVTSPADYDGYAPDWSLVIRSIVSGYGDKGGVDTTAIISEDEQSILCCGFALSSAYEVAKGKDGSLNPYDIYSPFGNKSGVLAYAETFNKIASLVPEEVYDFAAENLARLNLANLHTFNAWYVHERFWAVAGVLDPKTSDDLRKALGGYNGKISDIGFVNDLAKKLDLAILSATGNPAPQAVVELVQLSQQILMTLAAGVPAEDGTFIRLAPANTGDWEIIRKAMFLALSVTSNPTTAGNTFLSTLYNCGEFYHKKTDADKVKAYYCKLEAFSKIFSDIWKGNSDLGQVIKSNDISGYYALRKRSNTVVGSSFLILNKAYEEATAVTDINLAKGGLTASMALHPKLKHEQAFRTLYPDLTAWTNFHEPSPRAQELMTGSVVALNLPEGFIPQAVQLSYSQGKWHLKALKLDNLGKVLEPETILWTQAGTKDSLVGSLSNTQGTHLFNFDVDGPSTMIRAISTGYLMHFGGKGSSVTVASGQELGIIESSAYPLHTDIFSLSGAASGIFIEGESYHGKRGVLSAQRESVWIHAPIIQTASDKGSLQASDSAYQGQQISAYKDIILYGNHINVANSKITANQDVFLSWVESMGAISHLITHGSLIQAGHSIDINVGAWHVDNHTIHSGYPNYPTLPQRIMDPKEIEPYQRSVKRTSGQVILEFDRQLKYAAAAQFVADQQTINILGKDPHAYGVFDIRENAQTPYSFAEVQPVILPSSGGNNSFDGGSSSFGRGFISNNTDWREPSMRETHMQKFNQPMFSPSMSSMSYQGSEFSLSNRGGTTNIGGSASFASTGGGMHLGSTSFGASYSTGESGRSLGLQSTFTPPSLMESVQMGTLGIDPTKNNSALNLHMLSSAAILQMTAPKRLNSTCGKLILGGVVYGGKEVIKKAPQIADKLRKVYQAGKLLESATTTGTLRTGNVLNETGEKDKEKCQEESKSNTLTGGPKGEGPEGDGKGTQLSSKTLYSKDGVRIDVENPNPSQRPGQIHIQDKKGIKFLYDSAKKIFYDQATGNPAARGVQDLLKEPEVIKAMQKGEKILGIF